MKHVLAPAALVMSLSACELSESAKGASDAPPEASVESSSVRKEGYFAFDGRTPQKVTYVEHKGKALFQGDIVLDELSDPGRKTIQGVVARKGLRWDRDGIVVYDVSAMPAALKERWFAAIRHISLRTPLRFSRDKAVYRTATDEGTVASYIRVIPNPDFSGGYSSVGRRIGPQDLALSADVGPGVIAHELLHAIGHWHEHSRADRGQYVRVNRAAIQPGAEGNFSIHAADGQMVGAYDYCSLMHYASTAFSANGQPTLIPLRSVSCTVIDTADNEHYVSSIGQQWGLSMRDIATVGASYASVTPLRPFAFAGFDQVLKVAAADPSASGSANVSLNASRSMAVQGALVSYAWKPLGLSVCRPQQTTACTPNPIRNANQAVASVAQSLGAGQSRASKRYELTVTDSAGRTMRDVVTVTLTR